MLERFYHMRIVPPQSCCSTKPLKRPCGRHLPARVSGVVNQASQVPQCQFPDDKNFRRALESSGGSGGYANPVLMARPRCPGAAAATTHAQAHAQTDTHARVT